MGPADHPVHGRVLSASGPVAGARVNGGTIGSSPARWRAIRLATPGLGVSRADGSFDVRGVSPGRYRVLVDAPGFACFETWSDSRDEHGDLKVYLRRGATVWRESSATSWADLSRAPWSTRAAIPDARTGSPPATSTGRFRLTGLPAGPRYLCAQVRERQLIDWREVDIAAGERQTWDAELRHVAPLCLRLVDHEGRPLAEWGTVLSLAEGRAPWSSDGATDGEGRLVEVPPPPGRLRLALYTSIESRNNAPAEPRIVMELDSRAAQTIQVPAPLTGDAQFEATILDARGAPATGCVIELRHETTGLTRRGTVDPQDGRVHLTDLASTEYLVTIRSARNGSLVRGARTIDTRTREVIRLPPLAHLRFAAPWPEDAVAEVRQQVSGELEFVDRSAAARTYSVFPGTYELRITRDLGQPVERTITLGVSESLTFDVHGSPSTQTPGDPSGGSR